MIGRRTFLVALGSLPLARVLGAAEVPPAARRDVAETLRLLYLDKDACRRMAEAYLQGGRADAEARMARIEARLAGHRIDTVLTLYLALSESIADDFRRGRVASVGGWMLSETELDVCVVVSGARA